MWNDDWAATDAERLCREGERAVFPVVLVDGEEFTEGLAGCVVFIEAEEDATALIDSVLRVDLNLDLAARVGALMWTTGPRSP